MSNAPTGDQPSPEQPATPAETDWKAEAEKYRQIAEQTDKRAKRFEDTSKANAAAARELESLRQSSMSDMDKAVSIARQDERLAARREYGATLVDAELRIATAGRNVDTDALLEGLDRSRFMAEDGQPDAKAIRAWVDRIAPVKESAPPGFPDLGQGQRGNNSPLNGDPLEQSLKAALGMTQ